MPEVVIVYSDIYFGPQPSDRYDKAAARDFMRQRGRRAKFYADEDVDDSIVYVLRHKGYDVKSARERGLVRHADDFHFKRAAKLKCVLLSHDRDYLDHDRFPLSRTWGVCIVDVDRADIGQLARALEVIDTILGDFGSCGGKPSS